MRNVSLIFIACVALSLLTGCPAPDRYMRFYEGEEHPLTEMAIVTPHSFSRSYDDADIIEVDGKKVVDQQKFQLVGGVFGGNEYIVLQPGEHTFVACLGILSRGESGPLQKLVQLKAGYLYVLYPIVDYEKWEWTYRFDEIDLRKCIRNNSRIDWWTLMAESNKLHPNSLSIIEDTDIKASLTNSKADVANRAAEEGRLHRQYLFGIGGTRYK